jgi:hypothetical protein
MRFGRKLSPGLTILLFDCSDLLYDRMLSSFSLAEVAQNSSPSFLEAHNYQSLVDIFWVVVMQSVVIVARWS